MFFSSRRRHTRFDCDWSSDVCCSDLIAYLREKGARVVLLSHFGRPKGPDPKASLDRKSTRLNSSHSQISYAVFCLKKKKSTQYRVIFATPHHRRCRTVAHWRPTRSTL